MEDIEKGDVMPHRTQDALTYVKRGVYTLEQVRTAITSGVEDVRGFYELWLQKNCRQLQRHTRRPAKWKTHDPIRCGNTCIDLTTRWGWHRPKKKTLFVARAAEWLFPATVFLIILDEMLLCYDAKPDFTQRTWQQHSPSLSKSPLP